MKAPSANPTGKTTAKPTGTGEPSMQRRLLFLGAFTLAVVAIIALTFITIRGGLNQQLNTQRHDGAPVAANVTVRPFVSIDEENVFPMGLAAAQDGTLYFTRFGNGSINTIAADGSVSPLLTVGAAAGSLEITPDGTLYVIGYSAANENAVGALYRRDADGQLRPFGGFQTGFTLFASMVYAKDALYVTNPANGEVYRVVADGSTRLYWTAAAVGSRSAQLTAITYDALKDRLIVSDSGTGTVYELTPQTGDLPPVSDTLVRRDGFDARGLAIDEQGRVLLVTWQNDNGSLYRLEQDGLLTELATGFRNPTALVYRSGKAYVVNSDALAILRGNGIVRRQQSLPFTIDEVDLTQAAIPVAATTAPN